MTDDPRDPEIERLLARYRPAGPGADFRDRVLAAAPARPEVRPPIVELAAGLLIAGLLQWSSAETNRRAVDLAGVPEPAAIDVASDARLHADAELPWTEGES